MSESPRRRGRPLKEREPRGEFARRLWRWITKTGLTQEEAAVKLGVTRRTVQRWLYEAVVPPMLVREAVLTRIARAEGGTE